MLIAPDDGAGGGGGGGGALVVGGGAVVVVAGRAGAGVVSGDAVSGGPAPGAGAVVAGESSGVRDAVESSDVLVLGAPLLATLVGVLAAVAALAADRGPLLAAPRSVWESPPQAPSPTTATTTSAVTCRMVDVPTARMYGCRARPDCRDDVQSSNS